MSPHSPILQVSAARYRRGYAPTLGWYLARRWLLSVGLTLSSFGAFIALVNALEAMRSVADQSVGAATAALMSLLQLPDTLLQLLPFAVLIGTLVWLHRLAGTQELTAIRASGLPVRRFMTSAMVSCVLLGVTAVVVANPVAATLLKRYERWQATMSPPAAQGVLTPAGSLWLRQDISATANTAARTIFLYGASVQVQETRLMPATLFVFDQNNALLGRFDAAQATLQPGQWQLQQVRIMRPGQAATTEPVVALPTTLTPNQLAASLNPPATLNVWELQHLLGVLHANGWQAGPYAVAYANIVALPLFCLALLLLAIPFGLQHRRAGGVLARIGLGLGLGFGFFILRNWASAYALVGRLEPWLAAAVPVAVGLLCAFFLMVWLREE